jgi:hypothetical protein
MRFGRDERDRRLSIHVDDEHRVVVIGTPTGLPRMSDAEILDLRRRVRELTTGWDTEGYTITWPAEAPRWRP